MQRRQGRYWICTLSCAIQSHQPTQPPAVAWIKGQQEQGEGGFLHWQFIICLREKGSLRVVRGLYPGAHCELSRSDASEAYVWKEDTRIEGTQFEIGTKPLQRNKKTDWERIWELAKSGTLVDIPAAIRVVHYRTLNKIAMDHLRPVERDPIAVCYWGKTGLGKSHRAWEEAGTDAYPKDSRTKFWCGYSGQTNVIMDEFRGSIDVGHLLRWLDKYPCIVETKGSATVLTANRFWITSNLPPREWYPSLDQETMDALLRRMTITHFDSL